MKRQISVLYFYVRFSFAWIMAVLAALCVGELGGFWLALPLAWMEEGDSFLGLETLIYRSGIPVLAAVAFAVVAFLTASGGGHRDSRTAYTLRRLQVSQRSVYLWQAGYAAGCCLLLWAVQVGLLLAVAALYGRLAPAEAVGVQTLFLAVPRSPGALVTDCGWICLALLVGALLFCWRPARKEQDDEAF